MNKIITAVLFVGVSQSSFAGIYDLKFRRVTTPNDQAKCLQFAEQTARELNAQTGASIIDSGCSSDGTTLRGLDAVITYQSATRLAVTSTNTASNTFSAAFYTSKEECNQKLEQQKVLFTNATGLQPLTAYCMLDLTRSGKWETRIDGVGQSEVLPDGVALDLWGTLVNRDEVFAKYEAAAEGYGISFFESGISSDGLTKQLVLRLYANEPYSFEIDNKMKYQSIEACSSAAQELDAMLENADKPAVLFCVKNSSNAGSTLFVTSLVKTLQPTSVFASRVLTTVFDSMSACRAAAQNTPISREIFGAVCAGTGTEYRIHLFSRP